MLLKKLAAVGATVVVAAGLSAVPASAAPVTGALINAAGDVNNPSCLDFRADRGPYVTTCNGGDYQRWYWNNNIAHTALRQAATRLCLTVRNGQPTMKPCAATDQAALWAIDRFGLRTIKNKVSGQCLARPPNDNLYMATCTGGASQRWVDYVS